MFRAGAVDLKPGVYTANEEDDKNVRKTTFPLAYCFEIILPKVF